MLAVKGETDRDDVGRALGIGGGKVARSGFGQETEVGVGQVGQRGLSQGGTPTLTLPLEGGGDFSTPA